MSTKGTLGQVQGRGQNMECWAFDFLPFPVLERYRSPPNAIGGGGGGGRANYAGAWQPVLGFQVRPVALYPNNDYNVFLPSNMK